MANKIVKTLRFPGSEDSYQINAVRLDGHTWTEIESALQNLTAFDALRYMGALQAGDTLPAANKGDVYKVISAGEIAGAKVEIGDMLICNKNETPENTPENWDVVQANIDVDALLQHIHTGNVDFTRTEKTLTHSVTPSTSDISAQFKDGAASVVGNHNHTASGTVTVVDGGSVGEMSLTPAGTIILTAPAEGASGDVEITPVGTVDNAGTRFVKGVTVSEHEAHTHTGSAKSAGGFTPEGSVTVNEVTPTGSVASHKHDIAITAPTAQVAPVTAVTSVYEASDESEVDGVLTIGVTTASIDYVTNVSATEQEVAPAFTGDKIEFTASFTGTPVAAHTHELDIAETKLATHVVNTETDTHNHVFTGEGRFIHAVFNGTTAAHTHEFTPSTATKDVAVTVNEYVGSFAGTASGNVELNVNKVVTGVEIADHKIQTVDSASFTTSYGSQQ